MRFLSTIDTFTPPIEQLFLDKKMFHVIILVTSPSGLCGNTCTLEGVLL